MSSILEQNGKATIFIFMILLFREVVGEGTCSKGTDEPVIDCPRDKKSWIKAGERKNCTQFITKDCVDLQYHCLINAYGNGTVEVCAKLTYLQGFCAEYNPITFSIKNSPYLPCENFTIGQKCPSRYKSTDAYLYPRCYDLVNRKSTSNNTHPSPIPEEGSNGVLTTVIVLGIIVLVCVFGALVCYFKCRRRREDNDVGIPALEKMLKCFLEDNG